MTTFTIISVGKLKEKYFSDTADEYIKRVSAFGKINIVDLKEIHNEKETATKFLQSVPANSFVFALCIEGKQLSSEKFAEKLETVYISEKKGVCFLIGGSEGLPESVKQIADIKLSMSEMTFPHRLAKIMLLEQLYRALSIQNNGKYHK
ncbi:MAG: 23S rRNA (pseudouridine(1915)-N(3))-methyltransferase RlmH [Oscillospiraceae bacterium]|nr:23S rRNA (pseudouridine(1915)-N(3))-methyltransferase RlmH [Oscillospiraceae bacterium]